MTKCIFCGLNTARKKGKNTLSGGKQQQIWHCRDCGKTYQTKIPGGKVVIGRGKSS